MNYSNSIMTFVMLVIFAVMVGVSSGYPPGARFMTFVIGVPALLLCILQLALDARERRRAAEIASGKRQAETQEDQIARLVGRQITFDISFDSLAPGGEPLSPEEKLRRELIVWGYFLAFIVGIVLFGFRIAVPVFLFCFLRFWAESSWRQTVLLTAVASVAFYFIFEKVLRVSLHTGFITDYFFG